MTDDHPFVPDMGLTDAGSIRVHFRPAPPLRSAYGHERKLAALIYDLAAELERRCEAIGARWAISPEPFRSRLDVELAEHDDPEPAAELVAATLSDMGIA
jgi:hypothetical protein